ncbi:MAG: hypothetical protein RLZZ17_973, partial [Actinomycetota bacterium]
EDEAGDQKNRSTNSEHHRDSSGQHEARLDLVEDTV